MHLPIPLALLAQKVIDQTLPLDPDTQRALDAIDGKVIAVNVQQPPITFALSIADRDIQLLRQFDGEPDVRLSASVSDFLSMQSSETVVDQSRVQVDGDATLAREFNSIVYRSEVDWQGALAPFLGETVVHKLGEFGKRFGLWAGNTKSHMQEDTKDYLQEETSLLVSPKQVSGFQRKLESLVEQVDALDAKLNAFKNKGKPS